MADFSVFSFLRKTCLVITGMGTIGSAAHAANIAFMSEDYSLSHVASLVPAHTVTPITLADIDAGALSGYDALVIGHAYTDFSATTCAQIESFLNAGKGLVSEWNAATLLFTPAAGAYVPVDYSCALYTGTAADGSSTFGSDLPITITDGASPLIAGLSNPFSMGEGSEFVYQITGYGPEWDVPATFDGGGTIFPAVMWANYQDAGCVALSPFDYFDAYASGGTVQANYERLLSNLVASVLDPAQCRAAGGGGAVAVPVPVLPVPWLLALSALIGLAAGRRCTGRWK